MGRNSGGGAGGSAPKNSKPGRGDFGFKGKVENVRSLVTVKDKAVYKELKEGISRFESSLGVRQRNVKIAKMQSGVIGVHATVGGKTDGVYLNSRYFDQSKKWIHDNLKGQMDKGWQTKTKKPVQHVVIHELGHALWNNHMTTPNAVAAAPAVQKLYRTWLKDKKKKGYGEYSKTNVSEFWAETCAKATRGDQDRYTRGIKGIVKKYKL